MLKSSTVLMQSFEDLESEIQSNEENKQKMFTLGKSYDTMSGKIVTMTSKAKEGEKAVQTSVETLQKMEREVQESVKIVPVVAKYEILTDEKARRGSDMQSTKRKLSDSLTPIKEAESQLQSPEEESLKKTLKMDQDLQLHGTLGSLQLGKAEKHLGSEAVKAGSFAWTDKSLSEWRYSREQPFTIATAHYVTESSASKVVVTSGFDFMPRFKDKSMTSFRQSPHAALPFGSLAAWLCVDSSQPSLFFFSHTLNPSQSLKQTLYKAFNLSGLFKDPCY
ncbi:uncharacterized protein LOC126634795 [Myiozetetes cayanensis]|uniref:uncharacterized protein LOC126634795 n=1 Tax=Myiozetetes cayanensis TaxID=478635 RepID=UPI0021607A6D|nr:uncharacterized protein LOC126634795 [Myiozetetes cayanensis]